MDFPLIQRFGKYVTPYKIDGIVPRGFVHDGDSGVADLDHETAARHDWDYFNGASKLASAFRYATGYFKDQRPVRAILRLLGLLVGGWSAYRKHRKRQKEHGLQVLLAERMVPHADDDGVWRWPYSTWLLEDLKRR